MLLLLCCNATRQWILYCFHGAFGFPGKRVFYPSMFSSQEFNAVPVSVVGIQACEC